MLRLVFALVVAWFSTSCLIDFVAVPLVFQNVSKIHEAANIGIKLFAKYNLLEFIFGTIVTGFFAFKIIEKDKWNKILFIVSLVCYGIACAYLFKISPTIDELNQLRLSLEMESSQYIENEQLHNFYHQLYIRLDSIKVMGLLIALVGIFKKLKKEN